MFGSVFAAMVCLQTASSTDVEELAQFKAIAAKPEWSMSEIELLSSAISSKYGPVRSVAQRFWQTRYSDASEEYRFLCEFNNQRWDQFYERFVEPQFVSELQSQDVTRSIAATRSLLKMRENNLTWEGGCNLLLTLSALGPGAQSLYTKLTQDSDQDVAIGALAMLPEDHRLRRSPLLRNWFFSRDENQVLAALRFYQPASNSEFLSLSKHLWASQSPSVRRMAISVDPKKVIDEDQLCRLADAAPDYAQTEVMGLIYACCKTRRQTFFLKRLQSASQQIVSDSFVYLCASRFEFPEAILRQLLESRDSEVAQLALFRLIEKHTDDRNILLAREWNVDPDSALRRAWPDWETFLPDEAFSQIIKSVEQGGTLRYLPENIQEYGSRLVPVSEWLASGQVNKQASALALLPDARVDEFSEPILALCKSPDTNLSGSAMWKAAQSQTRVMRAELFRILSNLEQESKDSMRRRLCAQDDLLTRSYLASIRHSNNREERNFARETLYKLDHPEKFD